MSEVAERLDLMAVERECHNLEPDSPPVSKHSAAARSSPWGIEWESRQIALDLNTGGDWLEPDEIDQLEHLQSLKPHVPLAMKIEWIPRDAICYTPTDDFVWISNCCIHIEMKRVHRAEYKPIRNAIKQARDRLRKWDLSVQERKKNFLIDIGQKELRAKLRKDLEEYNIRNPDNQISRLWILWRNTLEEITLKKVM